MFYYVWLYEKESSEEAIDQHDGHPYTNEEEAVEAGQSTGEDYRILGFKEIQ